MHQPRNVAQHAGVALDADQLPSWADATIAFIDCLCVAAFGTQLAEIVLANAVRDQSLRTQLRWSEEQLSEDPGRSFSLAVGAFDDARARWRGQRNARVFVRSPAGYPPSPGFAPALHEVDEFLEVEPFAGDFGEYMWLWRARQEHEHAGWLPDTQEARRALLFVAGWIMRWEIFDQGYPTDRWEAHREGIQPPVSGDGTTTEILGGQVEFLPDVPGPISAQHRLRGSGECARARPIALGYRPARRAQRVRSRCRRQWAVLRGPVVSIRDAGRSRCAGRRSAGGRERRRACGRAGR